jgi:hypothetical protein
MLPSERAWELPARRAAIGDQTVSIGRSSRAKTTDPGGLRPGSHSSMDGKNGLPGLNLQADHSAGRIEAEDGQFPCHGGGSTHGRQICSRTRKKIFNHPPAGLWEP